MRAEDRMASLQLRKVLNRLEEEEGEKQEALKKRVEEERGKLEATMGFSRAAAVAALAQEVELQNARKVEKDRLKVTSKSNPTPTLPEASPESDRDRLLIENQRLAEEVSQLRARIHEMAGAAGSDAARTGVTVGGPAPSSTVAPSRIKAGTASVDDIDCQNWKGGMGKINEEEFNRLLEIEAATVLEELRANPPAHVKALLRVRQELDACAAAAVAVRNSSSILLSSGLLPAMAGGDIRDGTAGISSSEGAKAALRGVGTISAELAHR